MQDKTKRPSGTGLPARSTRVYFHVAYNELENGEEVRIVGNHPNLGSWEPEDGLRLTTHEDIWPCWISSEPTIVELNAQVEYKYVVIDKDGKLKSWEDRPDNRNFTASGLEMTIEDDEGLYRQFSTSLSGEARSSQEAAEALTGQLAQLTRTGDMEKMTKEQKLDIVKELEGQVTITENDTVFMFHFDLPYKVCRKEGGGWELQESLFSYHFIPFLQELRLQKTRVVCIGWPGIHVKSDSEQAEITKILEEVNCIPVWPPQQEFDEFLKFTDNFLWPLFHDVMLFFQNSNPPPFDEQGWASYQHINNIYANAVVSHAHDSDLIWIHDYHLMMMPTFISRKLARANIGLYLHAPFPSSDTFKSLPIREELLSGMLCADQVGFQFFYSVRNFVVSCKRIYGLDPTFRAGGFMGLDYNGRTVMIKVAHFGMPYQDTQNIVSSEAVVRKTKEVKSLFGGKTLFVAEDRCNGISGLVPKFRDFKRFLNDHPKYRGNVILVQYIGMSERDEGDRVQMESLMREADGILETDEATGALTLTKGNTEGSDCAVYVRLEQHDREDVLALFRAGHVLLDTCVKAGLNLMPFDFITAHHDDASKHSPMIVSEFSGCSRVLLGSLRINPWNSAEVVAACERAVEMGDAERAERFETNLSYVSDYSPTQWFEDFVADLRRARKPDDVRIENIGFGARIRPIAVGTEFQRLPIEQVLRSLFHSKRRVFFLDNEGTLAPDKRRIHREYGAPKGDVNTLSTQGAGPDESVLQCLRTLMEDSRNTVVILSGRPRDVLEEWFSSVPKIALCAERGFYYKLPSVTGDQWQSAKAVDMSWKSYAFELMRQFVKRTQGSNIENKGSALVWYYRDADPHYGAWQAKELSRHLKELLFGFDVEVVEGKGYVEVKLRHINKGVAVAKMLSKVAKTFGEADFVLCCGDDRSDEDMFEVVNYFTEEHEKAKDKDAETSSQLSTTDETHDGSGGFSDGQEQGDGAQDNQMSPPSLRKTKSSGGDTLGKMPRVMSMSAASSFPKGGMSGSISGGLNALGGFGDAAEDESGPGFYTCVVGRKPSAAKYFLYDTDEMSDLLQTVAAQQKKRTSGPRQFQDWNAGSLGGSGGGGMTRNAMTWSGGEGGMPRTIGSMPALNTLAFQPAKRPKAFGSQAQLNLQGSGPL